MQNDCFKKVIITLRAKDLKIDDDFEISSDITIGQLTDKFVQCGSVGALPKAKRNYSVLFTQKNKFLDKDISLAEAGVWDGSILVFIPV